MLAKLNDLPFQVSLPFTLDADSDLTFGMLARMVLMGDISSLFQYTFALSVALCVVPLLFFRIWHELVVAKKVNRPQISCRGNSMTIIQKYWMLSTVNRIIWPIVGFCLYLTFGPWSVSEVIDGHVGFIFVWGIFVKNAYLPGSLTYLHGAFQMMLCQFPLIYIFANRIASRYNQFVGMPSRQQRRTFCTLRKLTHAPFYLIIGIECLLAVFFWYSYGPVAFLLGPFRAWSVVFNITLWILARNVPDHCLK